MTSPADGPLIQGVIPWRFLLCLMLGLGGAATGAENAPKIENDQVRVLVVTSAPDVMSAPHDHKMNRVMIYLDSGQMTLTEAGGKVRKLNFKAGEALWSPAEGLHTSLNTSGHPVRIVEIELKSRPAQAGKLKESALDPLKVDPKRYKLEWENAQVRVLRARYAAREKGVTHEHVLNRVVAFVSDGNLKVTSLGGESTILRTAAGDVAWGGQATHIEENLSDHPFEVVVVELKL